MPPGASHAHPSLRWSVLAAEPSAVLVHQAETTRLLAPDGAVRMAVEADPFGALRQALAQVPTGGDAGPPDCPFGPGLYGYLAYDLGRYVEPTAGAARVRDIPLPDLHLGVYETVLALDAARGEAHLVGRPDGPAADALAEALAASPGAPSPEPPEAAVGGVRCNVSREAYLRAVGRARGYIAAGDIFQVNLSRRYTACLREDVLGRTPAGAAGAALAPARLVRLYRRLRHTNPAPYAAYLGLGQGRAVLSSSPELFLDLRGGRVVTRPIKGTRPRRAEMVSENGARRVSAPAAHAANGCQARAGCGAPPRVAATERSRAVGTETHRAIDCEAFNRRQVARLLASEKDRAELVMIVDLERNDLGRVCDYGTVRVTEPRRVEAYAAVFHTVATVEGRLHAGRDVVDLVRATFPGGSITGAPKVRAMQIIAELEPTRRSVYTGAVGYLGPPTPDEPAGRCVLNLAIRTLLAAGPHVHLQAGGGIVADSDPAAEFDETTDKARAMLAALGLTETAKSEIGNRKSD
ncbi:MAG: anthranilate synthase component I family protein [Phycisphaerae bacterium]